MSFPRAPLGGRVAGIDPGTRAAGYCVLEGSRVLAVGVIKTRVRDMAGRLRQIFDRLDAVLRKHRPSVVAVERAFVGRNPASALALGLGRGVALLCAARCGAKVVEVAPSEAKRAVGAGGGAAKERVQRMVQLILRLREPLPPDAADAAALALGAQGAVSRITFQASRRRPSAVRRLGRGRAARGRPMTGDAERGTT